METSILISENLSKAEKYQALLPQIDSLLQSESDLIANMANLSAVLKDSFGFLWVGFYLCKEDELVLGPFQGPIACTRIQSGKGVCGSAFEKGETILVDNVDEFPGHIACSPDSKSEIVIPLVFKGKPIGVLDIDSNELNSFDELDKEYLEKYTSLLLNYSKV